METYLMKVSDIWKDAASVKELCAPTLTDDEFKLFVSLGAQLGANPFTREIWAVKYGKDKPASIFAGRDFYRKKAQELPEYDGHFSAPVHENDTLECINGEFKHSWSLKERGKLIGAICVVYRKGCRIPFSKYVLLAEYNKGFSNWKSMPATMIEKVAEAQALRGAFQGTFAGTYDESEQWKEEPKNVAVIEPEPPKAISNGFLAPDRVDHIRTFIKEEFAKTSWPQVVDDLGKEFKVDSVDMLTPGEYDNVLVWLDEAKEGETYV